MREVAGPLRVGFMATLESTVISLAPFGATLEASASAFNPRGGANGACVKVVTCDDKATVDNAIGCVRTLQEAGVVATVNDQGTAGAAEVSAAMAEAGIPRVASNVGGSRLGRSQRLPDRRRRNGRGVHAAPGPARGRRHEARPRAGRSRTGVRADGLPGVDLRGRRRVLPDTTFQWRRAPRTTRSSSSPPSRRRRTGWRSRSVHRRRPRWPRRPVRWAANCRSASGSLTRG